MFVWSIGHGIAEEDKFLDDVIARVMEAPMRKRAEKEWLVDVSFSPQEVHRLTRRAIHEFKKTKMLLRIPKCQLPLVIVADLHGMLRELRMILSKCGDPHSQSYLFLGDFVDRGPQGVEVFLLLLALRCRFPSRVHLLRGNHEDLNTAMTYGFYDEVHQKFPAHGEKMWTHFVNCFNWMPIAALVADKIFGIHGGLSPSMGKLDEIDKLPRPSIIPPYGVLSDLVWNDPDGKVEGWATAYTRGIGFTFGSDVIESFCKKTGVDLIVRGHQINKEMFDNGYKFFANGRLLSIFSAPNYTDVLNDACVVVVSPQMELRFIVFSPAGTRRERARQRRILRGAASSPVG